MLTNKDIRTQADRSYKDFLLSVVKRTVFFPFHIKGNKGNANLPLAELYPALKHLIDHSKEKQGFGYALTYKEVNTRHSGIITLPNAIFFENIQDYLKFIEREADFLNFRKALDLTKRQMPTLLNWVENNVLLLQKHAADWAEILKIIQFFTQNTPPQYQTLFWRQLPIDVDLAAMEVYKPLILNILEQILPPQSRLNRDFAAAQYSNQNETDFDQKLDLRYDEPLLLIRFLYDENEGFGGATLGVTLSHAESKLNQFDFEKAIFITDKSVFLTFPKLEKTLVFYAKYPPSVFSKISAFKTKTCFFIGDISPKGFELLSDWRSFFPNIQSLMMDKTTFEAFPQHHETTKAAATFPPHLTVEEQGFYQFLQNLGEKNTLFQRNIAFRFLEKQVLEK